MDPLLGNACETNKTMAIAMQHLHKYAAVLVGLLGSGLCAAVEILLEVVFYMGPLRGYGTRPAKLS